MCQSVYNFGLEITVLLIVVVDFLERGGTTSHLIVVDIDALYS